jgi:hypothetical protein
MIFPWVGGMGLGVKVTARRNYLLATKVEVVAYDPESRYRFTVRFDLFHSPVEPRRAKLHHKTYGTVEVGSEEDIVRAVEAIVGRRFVVEEVIIS